MDDPGGTGTCWICGALATTGEHKIKNSLLKKVYGTGPWTANESELGHFVDGTARLLQSPGSDRLKFTKTLCADCNNSRTQASDIAFNEFCEHWLRSFDEVQGTRSIELSEIAPGRQREFELQLRRSFAKHLGCRIATSGWTVPEALSAFVREDENDAPLVLRFAIDYDLRWFSSNAGKFFVLNKVATTNTEFTQFLCGILLGREWPTGSASIPLDYESYATNDEEAVLQKAQEEGRMLNPDWLLEILNRRLFDEIENPSPPLLEEEADSSEAQLEI